MTRFNIHQYGLDATIRSYTIAWLLDGHSAKLLHAATGPFEGDHR